MQRKKAQIENSLRMCMCVCICVCTNGYICKFLHYAHSELQNTDYILPDAIASTLSNILKADTKMKLSSISCGPEKKIVQYQ